MNITCVCVCVEVCEGSTILTFFQLPRGLFRWNTLILVWFTVTD